MLKTVTLSMPGRTMMIDTAMGEIGDFTAECMADRGVLEIIDAGYEQRRHGVVPYHADGWSLPHELPRLQHGQSETSCRAAVAMDRPQMADTDNR